jgi:type VI secretion system secreted protein VgrG
VKVQFPWDRDDESDERTTCWTRPSQAWSGPSCGFRWIPRIGMKVVVHFHDGDPDRPMPTRYL